MQAARNLVRKQYMMGPRQVKKLERLAKRDKVSAAHIVRTAVDCYDPEHDADGATAELFELVSAQLNQAISETRTMRERLEATLARLEGS
ncbi:MAG: hypothetical protein N839_0011270 [Desulfofustis sp. PB-SRB1]|jgi:hypothetical protein|nr:hypothetical protein [Desulfofustis sp. PB-SRB1]MBL0382150.1 hypothetical protein [Desulfofustis sp. PB-SRB1]MBM1002983.1 hypothetical protein [Desulfofustis sp. PB-SRB1]HBH29044.1 hypothetical protein [Desulfofustis sp.]HBH30519.1 hypothetical protein [Desulfofustis sp.]